MRKIALIAAALILVGCDYIYWMPVYFSAVNDSTDPIHIAADGNFVGDKIFPGPPVSFTADIPITRRGNSPTSIADEETEIAISVYNYRTSRSTKPVYCRAGAKVKISVFYNEAEIECNSSWSW